MAPISYTSSTPPAAPAPYLHTRSALEALSSETLTPTAIGLISVVGTIGITIYIISAIIYFRTKPITLPRLSRKGAHTDDESNTDGRKAAISIWERGVPLHDRSGVTTTANSAFGDAYPSEGVAVNAGLEREILEILEAEAEVRAISRVVVRN